MHSRNSSPRKSIKQYEFIVTSTEVVNVMRMAILYKLLNEPPVTATVIRTPSLASHNSSCLSGIHKINKEKRKRRSAVPTNVRKYSEGFLLLSFHATVLARRNPLTKRENLKVEPGNHTLCSSLLSHAPCFPVGEFMIRHCLTRYRDNVTLRPTK